MPQVTPGPLADNPFCLSIGALCVRVGARDGTELGVDAVSRRFLVSALEDPDLEVDVLRREPAAEPAAVLFDSGALWRVWADRGSLFFSFRSPLFPDAPYKSARLDSHGTRCEVLLHPAVYSGAGPVYPLEFPLDELLFAHLLAQGRGLEVHACGVVDRTGGGLLLVGHSGAGKTTAARIWHRAGATILSDDRVIVRPAGLGFQLFGTPWHGEAEFALPTAAPLRHVLFLTQSDTNRVTDLAPAAGTAELMARCIVPHYSRSEIEASLASAAAVAECVPCSRLDCTADEHMVAAVRDTYERSHR